jgi:hypothetical protein
MQDTYMSRWSACQRRPPSRRIMPAVEVAASGIMSTNPANPTAMNGRL